MPVLPDPFDGLLRALQDGGVESWSGDGLCAASIEALRVDGAVLCVVATDDHAVIGASPSAVRHLGDVPTEDGDGPCIDAARAGIPLFVTDLIGDEAAGRWPVFVREVGVLGYGSLFSLPLQVGAIRLGAFTVFRRSSDPLQDVDIRRASTFALAATELLLLTNDGSSGSSLDAVLDGSVERRAVVHQAAGMVSVQLGVSLPDALSLLRAKAWAEGQSIAELARAVVRRDRRFD